MKIEWVRTEQDQIDSIVAKGKEITKLAHKFWNAEELTEVEKYLIAQSLFWLGNDMQNKSSRYLEEKKQGGHSDLPSFDILAEFYSYTLIEGKTKSYAYEQLMEKYGISDTTIKNMIKAHGEDVKNNFFKDFLDNK
ncbi:hypothetical protein [Acinetobacter indicus]|uniref:hypothetical protein n=1 Tax=Acinetobacter indicus TaxID=756892 RepID=UPI001362BF44|nr:hypothetical protein [Acinetobacter indicus]